MGGRVKPAHDGTWGGCVTADLALSPFSDFAEAFDVARYRAVPDDWAVAVSDVVNSTSAIARGRYKDVNMAGAATIVAVLNACREDRLPFAFGGDGGLILVPPEFHDMTRDALFAAQRLCGEAMGLELRCSLIPVAELRRRGREVMVAAYNLGSGRMLAMLAGGGLELAETLCKSVEGAALAVTAGAGECDLTGLSCRWEPLTPEHGVILALVVQAKDRAARLPEIYRDIHARIAAVTGANPTPAKRSAYHLRFPPRGARLEAALQGKSGRLPKVLLEGALSLVSLASGKPIGGFDARKYRESLPRHSDFRKYADSLRMVIDCREDQAQAVREALHAEWQRGAIDYGTHMAKTALMTCFVRNTEETGHIHFIDGADGGYALAARDMKQRMAISP